MDERGAERRVLVLTPSGSDARILHGVFEIEGVASEVCRDARALVRALRAGAGAVVVAEEAVHGLDLDLVAGALAAQDEWSDLPLILLATPSHDVSPIVERLWKETGRRATVLERPTRSSTLLATVHAALQARARQYQVRDELLRRNEAERLAKESEERYRTIFESSGVPLWEQDWSGARAQLAAFARAGVRDLRAHLREDPRAVGLCLERVRLLDANRATVDLLRAPDASALPTALDGLIALESRGLMADVLMAIASGRSRFRGEKLLVAYAGEPRHVIFDLVALPGYEDSLELTLVSLVDISDRKRMEESLRYKTTVLQEEEERKNLFLATLGHELRNPLAALDLDLYLLGEGVGDVDRVHRRMDAHVRQLSDLVNDLLEVSRITRGKLSLRRTRIDLAAVIRSVVESAARDVELKSQELEVAVPDRLDLEADPTRVAQILSNLLSNATKYTPEGGSIRVSAEEQGGDAVIAVRDTGQGLRLQELTGMFEPFAQDQPGGGGLGLGLALVKGLAELHGGSVLAESEGPGRGACFTVRLPIGDVARAGEETERKREAGMAPIARAVRVLVVDDVRDLADSLAMVLDRMGADTRTAYTGRGALEADEAWSPEVMLVDLGLPDMTGYEVSLRLRSRRRHMLLVAVTGFGDEGSRQRAKEAGFDEVMVKPVGREQLYDLLRRASAQGTPA